MKPEDMPKMMDMMMEKIFKEMKTEDKMAFMENMMPRCMGMMLENMNDEDRKSFAEKMMNRMFSELRKKTLSDDHQKGTYRDDQLWTACL